MKILFIGYTGNVHFARWIGQLKHTGWDIHVFDPYHCLLHSLLTGVTVHSGWWQKNVPAGTRVHHRYPFSRGRHFLEQHLPSLWRRIVPESPKFLAELILKLKPDCIHTLEMQKAAYTLYQARQLLGGGLPAPWIYSCWGNDIFYYRQLPEHHKRIRQVLGTCDYYICDCQRDILLAKEYGLKGEVLGVIPTGGGYPIDVMKSMRQAGPPSSRRIIALKGLHCPNWRGKAGFGLDALLQCADQLRGYKIVVYQSTPEMREKISQLPRPFPVPIEVFPGSLPKVVWRLLGTARISIGISISDGTPNTLLEAMAMGAFPIQTDSGGATREWIDDGVNGLIIPAESSELIAKAIRVALNNDKLVDAAAEINSEITSERINVSIIQPKVIQLYERVVRHSTKVRDNNNNA